MLDNATFATDEPHTRGAGAGEDGLSKALDRERTRYHERQSALLARVLRGKPKPKPAPGDPDPAA